MFPACSLIPTEMDGDFSLYNVTSAFRTCRWRSQRAVFICPHETLPPWR